MIHIDILEFLYTIPIFIATVITFKDIPTLKYSIIL